MGTSLSTKHEQRKVIPLIPPGQHQVPHCPHYIAFAQRRHVYEFMTKFHYYLPDETNQYSETMESSHSHNNSPLTSNEEPKHQLIPPGMGGDESYSDDYKVTSLVDTLEESRLSVRRRRERAVNALISTISRSSVSLPRKTDLPSRSWSMIIPKRPSVLSIHRTSTRMDLPVAPPPESGSSSGTLPSWWFPYR